jgi:hypothetical protein
VTIPPGCVQVGKFYVTRDGRLRRVVEIRPNGEVRYRYRSFPAAVHRTWRSGALHIDAFAATVEHEVPCDWRPDANEAVT